ncbi:MAG: glycosyl hydrolase [Acidobacteriota bacterium]|jgi:photosystem II stability/assembly factor-like uncharacterized protein
MRKILGFVVWCAGGVAAAQVSTSEGIKITSDTFGGLSARALGPAVMSGRITAIDAVPGDPLTLYVGTASGGVWKSTDSGISFKPVFDEHLQSIGALRVDPQDPRTVWVGTGECNVRNSVSIGDGVYRSRDGGESWQRVGLAASERIAALAVHPRDSRTVYVCALGPLWSAGEERGVFKTTDGGATWRKVLYVNDSTGCSDLAMDPQEPRILYAGMWQVRRWPDFFHSGGPGSGLYKSVDGGETWKELTAGLPAGEKGRIAVAVAPSRPSVVYALVEGGKTALYRSENLGESFTVVNSSTSVSMRPFYFAHLVVDPSDHNTVYKPGLALAVSTDGGASFTSPILSGGNVHSDHHALWINPRDRNELFLGTDGGVYHSFDRGRRWRFLRSLPVAQFYHVGVDLERPYNVYGGLQDNGTWKGPSRASGGVQNRHWENIGYGDGFWAFPDPEDPRWVYVEYQGGNILRVDTRLGELKDIKPYAGAGEGELRFNWNTPIHLSPNERGTVYVGAQYLFRSRDRGDSWERISPDLTTNDPRRQRQRQSGGLTIDNSTAENNTTIYAIGEAPGEPGVIWVGTDDGHLQLTRDGGRSWANLITRLPGVPGGTWVSSVTPSAHVRGRAYVTLDGHRSGDFATYVFRTDDYGVTWMSLATPDIEGYAWVIKEDPVSAELLFLGTEFGLYVSLDGGARWARFAGGIPKVAVHDIVIHPREGDLVVATHGRGIYILDDLTPLRALSAATLDEEVALLPGRPVEMPILARQQEFNGDDEFVGANPPEAAVITYWLKRRHIFGDLKLEIRDSEGRLLSTVPGSRRAGLNRVAWPMRLPPPKLPPASALAPAFLGPRVAEGTYTVKLVKGASSVEGQVTLVADPRTPHPPEDRAAQQRLAMQLYEELASLTFLVDSLVELRDQARQRIGRLPARDGLRRQLEAFAGELEKIRPTLVSTSEAGWLSGDEQLREKLAALYSAVTNYGGRPTASQLDRFRVLQGELATARGKVEALQSGQLPALNSSLQARRLEPLVPTSRESWLARQEGTRPGGGAQHAPSAAVFSRLFAAFSAALLR